MQIGTLGHEHSSDMHQVSSCMHNHKASADTGSAGGAASASVENNMSTITQQQEEGLSLAAWLNDPAGSARRLLGSFWNGREDDGTERSMLSGREVVGLEQAIAPDGKTVSLQEAVPTKIVLETQNELPINPYFVPVNDAEVQQKSFRQKARVHVRNISEFFEKQFAFSNRHSFRSKQGQSRDDLKRHSKFHGDDVEIDCILVDESHLRDSYNKKGEYSKLAEDTRSSLSFRN